MNGNCIKLWTIKVVELEHGKDLRQLSGVRRWMGTPQSWTWLRTSWCSSCCIHGINTECCCRWGMETLPKVNNAWKVSTRDSGVPDFKQDLTHDRRILNWSGSKVDWSCWLSRMAFQLSWSVMNRRRFASAFNRFRLWRSASKCRAMLASLGSAVLSNESTRLDQVGLPLELSRLSAQC